VRPDYVQCLQELGCAWRYAPKRRGLDPGGYRLAAERLLEMQPDVVIFHGAYTLPVLLCLRVRRAGLAVIGVHQGPPSDLQNLPGRARLALFSLLASRNVVVSQLLAEQMRTDRLVRMCMGAFVIIPNSLDVDFWRAEPLAPQPGRAVRLGMIGTFERTKDQETLLRATASLVREGRDVIVELVGDGPRRQLLERLAAQLDLTGRVRFLGEMSRSDVRRRLETWHVLVHATHGEAMSLAVLEGMAAARPVVASDSEGMRSLIEHGRTGLLSPPGDAQGLAGAIRRLSDRPDLARRVALAGRRMVERHFSAQQAARRYEALADSLIASRSRRR